MELRRLWAGMLTRSIDHSGTDSSITLIINQGGGTDRLHHTFRDSPQEDQEQRHGNLYEVDVTGNDIVPENINNSSIRVGIRGGDAWRPEHFVVWGERLSNGDIIPLAIETNIRTILSTDRSEGNISLPLRRVNLGNDNMQINRLLVLVTTANRNDAETDGRVNLQIVSEGNLVVSSNLDMSGVDDRERGEANFYFSPVITSFSKNSLKNSLDNSEIKLTIGGGDGNDDWLPRSFFLFGLDDATGRPESLVPLVHLRTWPHGHITTDDNRESVTLELVR